MENTPAIPPPASPDMQPPAAPVRPTISPLPTSRLEGFLGHIVENCLSMLVATWALSRMLIHQEIWLTVVLSAIGSPLLHKILGTRVRGVGTTAIMLLGAGSGLLRHMSSLVLLGSLLTGCAGDMPTPADARDYANQGAVLLNELGANAAAVCSVPAVADTRECSELGAAYERFASFYNEVPL